MRRSGILAVIVILKSSRSIALDFSQGEKKIRSQKSEVRSRKSEVRSQKSEKKSPYFEKLLI